MFVSNRRRRIEMEENMKKIKYLIITLSVISLILIYFYNNNRMITKASSDDENSILYLEMNDTTTEPKTIYSEKYQNKIQRQIDRAKQKNNYTFKEPLLIENPYGTNTTGVYMYFTTDEDYQATYTISCNGYEDFTQTLNTNTSSGYTKEHEYLLVGSIPGEKNIITVTLHDTQGNEVDTLTWSYQAPDLLGGNEYITVETETYDTNASLTNGLYTVLGNDVTEDSDALAYMRLYDNYGIIRSEIPIISYRSHRCLFDDNTMYISVSSTKIVGIDQTGYVSTIYDTGDYKLHHDYIFDDNKNLIVLASKKEAETSEDKIIMIDHDSGEVSELIDLIDLSRLKLTHFQCFSSDISQMMAQQLYELEQLTLRQQVLKTLISTNQSTFRLDKHQIDESINRIRSQYHVSPSGLFIPRVKSNALAKRDAYDESFTKWSIENFPKQSEWQRLYENIQQQVLMSQENPLQLLYTRLNETKKQRLILQNKIYLLRIQSQLCGQPIFYWDEVYEREVKKQGQHTHLTTGKMLTSKQKIGEIVVCENKYYIHSTT